MTDSITTHDELISAIYQSTSHGVTRKDTYDGTTIYRNGDRFFMIGEEYDDDGETFWGWTWSTGVYEAFGDGEVEEYFSTDGGQRAGEPLLAAIRHLGAMESTR